MITGRYLGPCPLCGTGLVQAQDYLLDAVTGETHAGHDIDDATYRALVAARVAKLQKEKR